MHLVHDFVHLRMGMFMLCVLRSVAPVSVGGRCMDVCYAWCEHHLKQQGGGYVWPTDAQVWPADALVYMTGAVLESNRCSA